MIRVLLIPLIFFSLTLAKAHSGRTDSSGCHNDRKNGGYHCHKAKTETRTPDFLEKRNIEKSTCCKVCRKGKACGNSCISRSETCHKSPGCACDG